MTILGFDGPSYAGKTTFIKVLLKKLHDRRLTAIHFPCYMDCLDVEKRNQIPLNTVLTIEEELQVIKIFLKIERERLDSISEQNISDVCILDRTVVSLISHNYALENITKLKFHQAVRSLILKNIKTIVVPTIHIYIATPQSIMSKRYPKGDQTIFTNTLYNRFFKEGYDLEKTNEVFINKSISFSLTNRTAVDTMAEYIINVLLNK